MTRLTYFTAPWCQPCKQTLPYVQKQAERFGVPVDVIDIDTDPEAAQAAGVQTVPTLIVTSDASEHGATLTGSNVRMITTILTTLQEAGEL